MKNDYQKLMEHIPVPAGLNDRVLLAARRQTAEQKGPKRLASRKVRPLVRTAVCAACALALVLGTVRFYPAQDQPEGPVGQTDSPAVVPVLSFGLTAYAAETGESYGPNADGGLAFLPGSGQMSREGGCYTNCLFQVEGENIQKLDLAIDRGGLYRHQIHSNLTERQMADYRQAMAEGTLTTAAISQDDNGVWSVPEMTALGSSVSADYDPEVQYGFWVPPEEMTMDSRMDFQKEFQANVDVFDGAVLTVTVTFADGSSRTQSYRLHTGKLRVEWNDDGSQNVLPELADGDDPYIYGVYAMPEK